MPQSQETAVLLLAHGTPNALGEMADYLARVTGGRALPPEVVAELQHRYAQIGLTDNPHGLGENPPGVSDNPPSVIENPPGLRDNAPGGDSPGTEPPPLTKWTMEQGRLLEAALAAVAENATPLRVYAAMRNWHPLIADVVEQMRADGVARVLAICLAPQNSRTSIGLYRRALMAAVDGAQRKMEVSFVDSWSEEPALVDAFAERLAAIYPRACAETKASVEVAGQSAAEAGAEPAAKPGANTGIDETDEGRALPIVFTAHSVPCRTIMSGAPAAAAGAPSQQARAGGPPQAENNIAPDPYPVEAKRTAELVFKKAAALLAAQGRPAPQQYVFAFQSQGVAGGPWIGPTVEETLAALAAEGHRGVVLQPIGFLCDHVEILYDIDIAFAATARSLNQRLFRAESLNDSPLLTQALVSVVARHLPRSA